MNTYITLLFAEYLLIELFNSYLPYMYVNETDLSLVNILGISTTGENSYWLQ